CYPDAKSEEEQVVVPVKESEKRSQRTPCCVPSNTL
ncbi:hypothetical protein CDAR_193421, partial [Caerostris darwini]